MCNIILSALSTRTLNAHVNVNNIVHTEIVREAEGTRGGRYFATRLRTTCAIRTQLLFHPIAAWLFPVLSFSRLLRYSSSLAPGNDPVFFGLIRQFLPRPLARLPRFSFSATVYLGLPRYQLSALKRGKRRVKFDGLEK